MRIDLEKGVSQLLSQSGQLNYANSMNYNDGDGIEKQHRQPQSLVPHFAKKSR